MLSIPPAIAALSIPSAIDCAARATDFKPEEQTLFTVVQSMLEEREAGAVRMACRAGDWPMPALRTLPMYAEVMLEAGRVVRSRAERMAVAPRVGAGIVARLPPN